MNIIRITPPCRLRDLMESLRLLDIGHPQAGVVVDAGAIVVTEGEAAPAPEPDRIIDENHRIVGGVRYRAVKGGLCVRVRGDFPARCAFIRPSGSCCVSADSHCFSWGRTDGRSIIWVRDE